MLKSKLALSAAAVALFAATPAQAGYVEIYEDTQGYQMGHILYCEDGYTVIRVGGDVEGYSLRGRYWVDTWEEYGC